MMLPDISNLGMNLDDNNSEKAEDDKVVVKNREAVFNPTRVDGEHGGGLELTGELTRELTRELTGELTRELTRELTEQENEAEEKKHKEQERLKKERANPNPNP